MTTCAHSGGESAPMNTVTELESFDMDSPVRMHASRLAIVTLCGSLIAVSGCAINPPIEHGRPPAFVISAEEIDQRDEATVAQLVERLRPTWVEFSMERRGPDTFQDWQSPPILVRRLSFYSATEPCRTLGGSTPTGDVTRLELLRKGYVRVYCGERPTAAK
jgi:hypothetical protein